ncbi:MAG TPA: IclR family transcriptional regulator [Dermatophilaceae bacterium]|nr:IclR family transcriptional regulator [Dermatophilaceae bacterium]
MSEPGARRPSSVARKISAILDAFDSAAPQLSLTELARRSGLPVSTAYRLANELVDLGMLEAGDRGGYRIGLRLWETASLARRGLSVREHAVPFMLDLYEATHENVHLAVLEGYEALYVEQTTGRRSVAVKAKEARRLPLHATGVGKVLLAYSSESFRQEVLQRPLPGFTPHTMTSPAQLLRALADIRRNGYGYSAEELTLGVVSVAAPVFDADNVVVAALSLVGRSARAEVARLAPAVRTAAFGISRQVSNRQVAGPVRSGDPGD